MPGTSMHNAKRFDPADAHKLDDPDRPQWLPIEQVLDLAGIQPGLAVADVGAGTGYFTIPIARRVGKQGRVFAVDVQPPMIQMLKAKLREERLQVETILSDAVAMHLPSDAVDVILMANTLHEVDNRARLLAECDRVLHRTGRVVVVEWRADVEPPPGPPADHRLSQQAVEHLFQVEGWNVASTSAVGSYSYLVVATPSLD